MSLTDLEVAAAYKYLKDVFSSNTASDGEVLYSKGKMELSVKSEESGSFYSVSVTDPRRRTFDVSLECVGGDWFVECSCIRESACEHCYAALRTVLAQVGQSPERTPKGGKETKGRKKKAVPPDEQFVAEIEKKMQRSLEMVDRAYVQRIYTFWLRNRESTRIAESAMHGLLSKRIGWEYATHEVWDRPPVSPWEAWLYLAAFLAKHDMPLPPFLAQITESVEVDRVVAEWRRRLATEQWDDTIRNYVDRSSGLTRMVELRVAFEEKALVLESRETMFGDKPFVALKQQAYTQLNADIQGRRARFDPGSRAIWEAFRLNGRSEPKLMYSNAADTVRMLLTNPLIESRMVTADREPFLRARVPLVWQVLEPTKVEGDYEFRLVHPDRVALAPALIVLDGAPGYYVVADTIYETPPMGIFGGAGPVYIPAEVIETERGMAVFDSVGLPLPPDLAARAEEISARVVIHCVVTRHEHEDAEYLRVKAIADMGPDQPALACEQNQWTPIPGTTVASQTIPGEKAPPRIRRVRREALALAKSMIEEMGFNWNYTSKDWSRPIGKKFPAEFIEWSQQLPPGVELRLDPMLATLREDPVAAKLRLDVTESGMDWFDLKVSLDVSETHLTKEELALLMAAEGGFVRLGDKGWRRLEFQVTPEEEQALADAGLDARDFSGETHRMHALQLAGKSAERLLPAPQAAAVRRRVEEIHTRITPEVPASIQAELRPYQVEGYHFLAYLSANRFGGILADDMGLGKTLQTLTWIAWLRELPDTAKLPSLVICPKSVVMNWVGESQRFLPGLRVKVITRGECDAKALAMAREEADLLVMNYAQLRSLELEILSVPWLVAILDEAQFIKNPDSQTTRVAVQLNATYRLALTGTPIENRLLDLWSIMSFAMPGALGVRGRFQKTFDQRKDPFARMRLASRVRPFVLRRAKREVAKDLPERSEEDLLCEMEGTQAVLYAAELKRARQILLKMKTVKELDRSRFNILTSLMRLRQICCHPALVSDTAAGEESAKLTALLDLLEPLIEEGHKVLVFSQFTGMLDLISTAIRERGWPSFMLTGQTEDRQPLVDEFQKSSGAAVFLISLRAGGFGLNLTAASYVVLFDPWWNPAVENQAIDRTHRIGQTNKVNAYRLVVKNSIEEKIRQLQKQKRALAEDVLGEEAFARTLSMDDFKYLLEGE